MKTSKEHIRLSARKKTEGQFGVWWLLYLHRRSPSGFPRYACFSMWVRFCSSSLAVLPYCVLLSVMEQSHCTWRRLLWGQTKPENMLQEYVYLLQPVMGTSLQAKASLKQNSPKYVMNVFQVFNINIFAQQALSYLARCCHWALNCISSRGRTGWLSASYAQFLRLYEAFSEFT